MSRGIRKRKGPGRFAEDSNVVVLDPDVAAEFKTRNAVNDAPVTEMIASAIHVIHMDESDRKEVIERFGSGPIEITTALHPLKS